MKAILKFDLDEPADKYAHMRCIKSLELCLVISGINNYLRELLRYPPDVQDKESFMIALERVCNKISELEQYYDVQANEIME